MSYYKFEQKADKAYDLYLYDEIRGGYTIDWSTWDIKESETGAKAFKNKLAEIPDDADITLYINSSGGDVFEAAAIYSQLAKRSGKITAVVDGCAHSAAFTVLQCADHRVMYLGTSAIIHNMWTEVMGNANDLRHVADQLDTMMETVTDVLMERAKISRKKLRQLMDAETVLTPQMALEYGLIDEVRTPAREAEEDNQLTTLQNQNRALLQKLNDMTFRSETANTFQSLVKPAVLQEADEEADQDDKPVEAEEDPADEAAQDEADQADEAAEETQPAEEEETAEEAAPLPEPVIEPEQNINPGVGFNAFFHA